MGYTTYFEGAFTVTPTLSEQDRIFLTKLSDTRRMVRNIEGYGVEGEFYVDGDESQYVYVRDDDTIIDPNRPPSTQPGLWCQWIPDPSGRFIEWDGGEKFYHYVPWLFYIVERILEPKGYRLDGRVHWQGEDEDDNGVIFVHRNCILWCNMSYKYNIYYLPKFYPSPDLSSLTFLKSSELEPLVGKLVRLFG